MRALTLCVGISKYSPDILKAGERPLEFLADSAAHLSSYFRAMWPGRDSTHLLAVDADATFANVRSLVASAEGEYDIFVLYLGGHGRDERSFQFLFFGNTESSAVVSSAEIDALIERRRAKNSLLLLDACYAGKHKQSTTFFRHAPSEGARLCITSSRHDQKSWEDYRFRRSLFVDALTKALTSTPREPRAMRSVSAEIFPNVATDVTKHAFALKRSAAQEPDIFGSSLEVLLLPTTDNQRTQKPSMTTYRVLLLRIRQIGIGVGLICALGFVTTFATTWRPATNLSGFAELRAGPKWMSPLNLGPWRRRVETDVTTQDYSNLLTRQEAATQLLNEEGVYVWPGTNAEGVRRWADIFIERFLKEEVAARWRIRLGYRDAVERLTTAVTPGGGGGGGLRAPIVTPYRANTISTATELAGEAQILDPTSPLADSWQLDWTRKIIRGTCRSDPISQATTDRLELFFASSEKDDLLRWLRGLVVTAHVSDAIGFEEVAQLVEMFTLVQRRWIENYAAVMAPDEPITASQLMARFDERPSLAEVRELGRVGQAVLKRRISELREIMTASERARLMTLFQGCEDIAVRVLAPLGEHGDPPRVIAWAHTRARADQGRLVLRDLAVRGALPVTEVDWVLDTLGFSGDATDRKRAFVNASAWLKELASVMPLSVDTMTELVAYALERQERGDVEGSREALRLIAYSAQSITPELGPRVRDLMERAFPAGALPLYDNATLDLLGLLARARFPLSVEERAALTGFVDGSSVDDIPRVTFTETDREFQPHQTRLVAGVTSVELIALSRYVLGFGTEGISSDRRVKLFLDQAVSDAFRFGVPQSNLTDVIAAAAVLRAGIDTNSIAAAIRRSAADSAERRREVEVAKAVILASTRKEQRTFLEQLRELWRREHEPEAKLALAQVIIDAVMHTDRLGPDWLI